MSDIVEKTLTSLPRLFSENLLGGFATAGPSGATGSGMVSGGHQYGAFVSRGFHSLVRNVDYARSVAKEQHIIQKELTLIQQRLAQPDISVQQIRDYLTRLIFCHMIGYDVSCGYIHAVKLAQRGTGWMKWIGYLSSGILLHEDHELVVLLINTILKDLRSTNILDNCIALSAVSRLANTEMIPLVLPVVEEKLIHSRPSVRKKAVAALFNIWRKNPDLVPQVPKKFSEALCDKDPSVVSVSLNLYHMLIKENPSQYKNLGTPFLNILQQILKRKLPPDYDYHSIPNPWMQISLLRLLTLLGADDKNFSLTVYPVLKEVLQRANMKENIAFAIIYECILTISRIVPDPDLLEEASRAVGKFLRSSNQNLKYLGMKALTSLVVVAPHYAVDYQMIVMECLENPDAAIQRKTLELMYQMANPVNIDVISRNLLKYISKTSHDPFWQADIVAKLFSLVEKLSSGEKWYVETINQLLEVTNGNVPDEIVYRLLNVIDNASKDDKEFAQFVCTSYTAYLKKEVLPDTLIQVAVWVLGESPAEVIQTVPASDLLDLFFKHAFAKGTSDNTHSWIWMAITKLLHSLALSPELVHCFLTSLPLMSMSSETQQRFQELMNLVKLCQSRFKDSTSEFDMCEMYQQMQRDSELDFTLSFVDDFVSESLENGAQPYKCRQQRIQVPLDNCQFFGGLEYGSYHTPTASLWDSEMIQSQDKEVNIGTNESTEIPSSDWITKPSSLQRLALKGVKQVWSKDGLIEETSEKNNLPEKDANSCSNKTSMIQSGSSSSKDSKLDSSVDSVEKQERDELASALFAGLPAKVNPATSTDDLNEASQDEMSTTFVCNPKFGHVQFSSPVDQLSRLRTEKRENSFDWHTLRSSQAASSFGQLDANTDEVTSNEASATVETAASPSSSPRPLSPVPADSKISSLYSDFYASADKATPSPGAVEEPLDSMDEEFYEAVPAKATDPPSRLETDYVYLDTPLPAQPTQPSVIVEEENPEDIPLSVFAPLAILDNLILQFCKMRTTSGLCVILFLDNRTADALPTDGSISLECSECLMPSVEAETASIKWSKTDVAGFQGHIPKTGATFPIYSKVYLQPTEIQTDILSIQGHIQLTEKNFESQSSMQFSIPLIWIDFARPHILTLEEFTESWLKFSHSEKVTIQQAESQSLGTFISRLCRIIPAHCIYYKDGEALLSGQFIGSVVYLLHMKLVAKTVTVLLKADKDVLNMLTQYLT